ncbi:Homoserine kinase [Planctomycetes bacterium Poly30]|uniref:Homoserine kinase n=2 Tax=Saltatorellus ferox TaxID=2528018 RepID=A0A518EUN7_9BACT|nr:Homoserine kinase [Planctomycetes bacterium Poly30]
MGAQEEAGRHRVTYGPASDAGPYSPGWSPEEDLALRSLAKYEAHTGRPLPPLHIDIRSEIPVGRGLGSSGAAIAAALLLAAAADEAAGETPLARRALISLALELEGHPDNGTASLMGGCTAAVPTPGDPAGDMAIVEVPIHDSLGLAVAWPRTPLFTHEARAVLPCEVPLADAIENPRRLALLLEGLGTGDPRLLRLGVVDRIHERFRRALVPGVDEAIAGAIEAGAYAACLSGAGSGVVAIGEAGSMDAAAAAMARSLDGGFGRAVDVVRVRPRVRQV